MCFHRGSYFNPFNVLTSQFAQRHSLHNLTMLGCDNYDGSSFFLDNVADFLSIPCFWARWLATQSGTVHLAHDLYVDPPQNLHFRGQEWKTTLHFFGFFLENEQKTGAFRHAQVWFVCGTNTQHACKCGNKETYNFSFK